MPLDAVEEVVPPAANAVDPELPYLVESPFCAFPDSLRAAATAAAAASEAQRASAISTPLERCILKIFFSVRGRSLTSNYGVSGIIRR